MNRNLILAVGDELSFVLHAGIGAFLAQEVRSEHFLALGTVSDANACFDERQNDYFLNISIGNVLLNLPMARSKGVFPAASTKTVA